MPSSQARLATRDTGSAFRTLWPLLAVMVFFLGSGFLAGKNIQTIRKGSALVIRSQATMNAMGDVSPRCRTPRPASVVTC